jgi:hypothetical protein
VSTEHSRLCCRGTRSCWSRSVACGSCNAGSITARATNCSDQKANQRVNLNCFNSCNSGLEGTGRRMPVPVHVPSNGKVPVPYRSYRGPRSNIIDLLGQGVFSMVPWQGGMAYDTVIQLLYNDGCTAASSPYPYKGIVNAYYHVPVVLLVVCLQHAGERSWPRWQAAQRRGRSDCTINTCCLRSL